MIFPYVRYETKPSPTIPSGVIQRPRIPIRLIGPTASVRVFGLLDTGADNVFVSASIAEILGVQLREEPEEAIGAGDHALDVRSGPVEIELSQQGESYRWQVEVGFLATDDEPPIAFLGHAGFLEHFKASFDGENWQVELVPHGDLVRPT